MINNSPLYGLHSARPQALRIPVVYRGRSAGAVVASPLALPAAWPVRAAEELEQAGFTGSGLECTTPPPVWHLLRRIAETLTRRQASQMVWEVGE